MKKFLSMIALGAVALGANAAATTDHLGQGMSGENAYTTVTFTCAQENKPDLTAIMRYTFTATADDHLAVEASFENLEADKFIGLVDACYMIIEGIGETPLTLADGKYTATTTATFTEGTEYKGFFKRMSAADWYGGDLLFNFVFTYSKSGSGEPSEPVDPVVPVTEALNVTLEKENPYFAPGWNETDCTYTVENGVMNIEMPVATFDKWQAQFSVLTDIVPNDESYYGIAYDIKSDKDLPTAYMKFYVNGDDDAIVADKNMDLKADAQMHVFACGKGFAKEDPLKVLFDFGGNPAATKVTVSNIRFWRSNVMLTEEPTPTGVATLGGEMTAGEVEYYTLQGIRVAAPAAGQILIRREGSRSTKVRF